MDAVVVGEIGSETLTGLFRSGFKVYRVDGITVAQNLESLSEGTLEEITFQESCGGHTHGHGSGRGH